MPRLTDPDHPLAPAVREMRAAILRGDRVKASRLAGDLATACASLPRVVTLSDLPRALRHEP